MQMSSSQKLNCQNVWQDKGYAWVILACKYQVAIFSSFTSWKEGNC